MPIETTPGIEYEELESNPNLSGEGGEIAVLCGITTNTGNPSKMFKFYSYDQAEADSAHGGILNPNNSNPNLSLEILKDFFTESAKDSTEDIGVNYVYFIDMGANPTTMDWLTAMATIKRQSEIQVESYVGTSDVSLMESCYTLLKAEAKRGNPRIAYYTKYNKRITQQASTTTDEETHESITIPEEYVFDLAPDSELISLTSSLENDTINRSRIGIIEPDKFGKHLARICVTPYYVEPGFLEYRTVKPGEFKNRTDDEEKALQNAGIIFGRDEVTRKKTYPKICLGVSTATGLLPRNRPNDHLLHARRNTDNLIRNIYDTCYEQLKNNEDTDNLPHLQTDIDDVIDEEIRLKRMNRSTKNSPGTSAKVKESDSNPYNIMIDGVSQPVNHTHGIRFGMYIAAPSATIEDQI